MLIKTNTNEHSLKPDASESVNYINFTSPQSLQATQSENNVQTLNLVSMSVHFVFHILYRIK